MFRKRFDRNMPEDMRRRVSILVHLAVMGVITALLVFCAFYPFLPGAYDGLAITLSVMAQLIGTVGLLLVPVGAAWLIYEVRKWMLRSRNLSTKTRGYSFALVSVIVASVVVAVVSIFTSASIGISFGFFPSVLWIYYVWRQIPGLKYLKRKETEHFNPAPLYLVFIPVVVFLFQVLFVAPATEFSRNSVIAQSAELINDIEAYHTKNGHYPVSLLAVWKDYPSSIVGIEQFFYAPDGNAYNLFFEQPGLLFDNFGTREFVVYNSRDEHVIPSHDSWILVWTPEELEAQQGWYAVHDTTSAHWKYFWFD